MRKLWFVFCQTAISQKRDFKSRNLVLVYFPIFIIVCSDFLTSRYAYFILILRSYLFLRSYAPGEKKEINRHGHEKSQISGRV